MTDLPAYREKTHFIIQLGRALHNCGASSDRIESYLGNAAVMLELKGSFLMSPTTFTCAFWDEDEMDQYIHIERVKPVSYDMSRLCEIDRVVESMEMGRTSFLEGNAAIKSLAVPQASMTLMREALCWVLTAGAFAALIDVNPLNCLVSSFLAFVICCISRMIGKSANWSSLMLIMSTFITGLGASVIQSFGADINVSFVILSTAVLLVPGLSLTVALTEISNGHLVSGTSRLMAAIMTLLQLFFGTLSGLTVGGFLQGAASASVVWSLPDLPDWRIWPALACITVAMGIAFNTPLSKLGFGFASALIAYGVSKFGEAQSGIYMGMFLGALAVGLVSNLYARLTRAPGSMLMVHGILILVPGSRMYSILSHWVSGEFVFQAESGGRVLMGCIALIVGLLFANALLPSRKSL